MSRRPISDLRGRKLLVHLMEQLSAKNGHGAWRIFGDFVAMAALAISNSVDLRMREAREAEYMQLVKRYEPEDMQLFPQMLAALVDELESGMTDCLGSVFHDLELHNKYAGQFFSPYVLCQMMAQMSFHDSKHLVEERGYVKALEPAAGGGAMVIALAHTMRDAGVNYQKALHVTAVDVDIKCVHMCYTQLALLHVPAVVIHGNSLTLEEWSHWYTPAHYLGLWGMKLFREKAEPPPPLDAAQIAPTPGQMIRAESDTPGKRPKTHTQLTLF